MTRENKKIFEKDFLLIFYEIVYLLLERKFVVLSIIVFCMIVSYSSVRLEEKKYTASSTLYPDEMKPTQQVTYLFEQFSSVSKDNTLQILINILQSRTVSERVVRQKVDYYSPEDTSDYLYDVICANFVPQYKRFKGKKNPEFSAQSGEERETKIYIAGQLAKYNTGFSTDGLGFFYISSTWTEGRAAELVVRSYIDVLLDLTVEQQEEKALRNLRYINTRYDSIRRELEDAERRMGIWEDEHQNLVKQEAIAEKNRIQREVLLLQSLFTTIVTQRENAVVALTRQSSILQVLDPPRPPYGISQPDVSLYAWTGVVIGMLLSVGWIVIYDYLIRRTPVPIPEKPLQTLLQKLKL